MPNGFSSLACANEVSASKQSSKQAICHIVANQLRCAKRVHRAFVRKAFPAFLLTGVFLLFFGFFGCAGYPTEDKTVTNCIVEGQVESVSILPDPASSAYPNCNFSCTFKVKQIIEGTPVPADIVLIFPGFQNYKNSGNKIAVQERIRVEITPLEAMPESFRQTQLADDNENFELPYFAVRKYETLRGYTVGNYLLPLTKVSAKWWEVPCNQPLSSSSRKIRAKQMEENLQKAEIQLAALQQRLPEYEKAIQKFSNSHPKQPLHLWHNDCFFGCAPNAFYIGNNWVRKARENDYKTTLPQMKALNRFFAFHNIDLVVCVLPSPDEVSIGEFVPEALGYRNEVPLKLITELIHSGIDAVDLYDTVIEHRYDYPLIFQYHRNNAHPHTGLCAVAGKYLASYLTQRKYLPTYPMQGKIVSCSNTYFTNVWAVDNGRYPLQSPVPLSQIQWTRKESAATKEVLIAGNSFSTYPIDNGAIGDYFSFFAHTPYDWIGGENGASSIPSKLLNSGEKILKGKKVAILFVAVGHLLDSSFQDMDLLTQTAKIQTVAVESPTAIALQNGTDQQPYKIQVRLPDGISPKQVLAMKVYLTAKASGAWAFAEIPGNVKQNFSPFNKSFVLKLEKKLRKRNFEIEFYYPGGSKFSGTVTKLDLYLEDD